jgi:hypothetical protein
MNDDLDLRVIERHHDADPRYRAELRRRVAAILDGSEELPEDDTFETVAIDFAAPRPTRLDHRRRRWVLGGAALVAAAAAVAGLVVVTADHETPARPVDSVPPTTTEVPASGGMWPQSTVAEVQAAQARADAGDPDYTWQLGAQLAAEDPEVHVELELVDRFIREVLGWEAYRFNGGQGGDDDGWEDGDLTGQRYIRCAPGRTNPLYPSESCAPTLDDIRFESVSLDLAQAGRQGPDGIWVVNRWQMTAPFAQIDPAPIEAQGRERLEEFLTARIAGTHTGGYVQVDGNIDVPLLYATTSGARYERYEIERVDGPVWPAAWMTFLVRLFADGGATVVEQTIRWSRDAGAILDPKTTTENGQPVSQTFASADGQVTFTASVTWNMWWPETADGGVWFGGLWRAENFFGSGERIGFVDPVAYDSWCAQNGGSPLLTAPSDAAAIAQQVIADPSLETTAPVATRIGGREAVSIDVALAPGGTTCGVYMIEISRWIHELEPGVRLRLYLVDLPAGMPAKTLAITIVAPDDRFEEFIAETAPIIESIQFHPV